MQRLGPTINLKDFKLPKLVVIGNQNRGKSSLMESITKCPIFPLEMTLQYVLQYG